MNLTYSSSATLRETKPNYRTMTKYNFVPYTDYKEYPSDKMKERARKFYEDMKHRRTIREFSSRSVPKEVIEDCIRTAGTAPNGANMQPWHFEVVGNPGIKKKIRIAAEDEEEEFYEHRASDEWLEALEPFGTGPVKPFLEEAPWLIIIFEKRYGLDEEGDKRRHYYVKESVGIATGMLITALYQSGLSSLTHTPSPMEFLNEILERPDNERPFLVLVAGYPKEGVKVPDITKKPLEEIANFR